MNNTIDKFIKLNKDNKTKVAVVGDVMIDEYHQISANRISPEFPIPIIKSTHINYDSYPGGAANTAIQFKNLNSSVDLYGFNNFDFVKVALCHIEEFHLNLMLDYRKFNFNLPVKKRFYQGEFPVARWDIELENDNKKIDDALNELQNNYKLWKYDVVVLSDYNKGFFKHGTIKNWLDHAKVSVVDPKKGPASKWKGCTIFKPNSKEAEELSGYKDWKEQAKYLQKETEAKAVIITQSGDGVVGLIEGEYFEFSPEKQIKATSVIGAGDCFIAYLSQAIAVGLNYREATEVAFEAGRAYVQRKHNQPVNPLELINDKFVSLSYLKDLNQELVFTNGCFDILHEAHLSLLKFAKSKGEKLVVALNSDESVKRLKGPNRPINSLEDRMNLIAAFDVVDFVVSFNEDTPYELIKEISPTSLVKGGDYEKNQIVGNDLVKNVYIFPYKQGKSSTILIQKMEN